MKIRKIGFRKILETRRRKTTQNLPYITDASLKPKTRGKDNSKEKSANREKVCIIHDNLLKKMDKTVNLLDLSSLEK